MRVPHLLAALTAPPARWPLPWHVAGALACVAAVATFAAADHAWRRQRHADASGQLADAHAQLARVQRDAAQASIDRTPPLAGATTLQAMLRDIGALAAPQGARVTSVRLDHGHAPGRAHRVIQVALHVQGSYAAIKSWLSALQDRHPAIGLASLSLRRAARDPGLIDADIALSLYLQLQPGTSVQASMPARATLQAPPEDPFVDPVREAPLATVTVPPPPASVPLEKAPAPAAAPALNLQYTGRMAAPDGSTSVFAQFGGEALLLRAGLELSNGYRVERITDHAVELLYPPLNRPARLDLPPAPAFEVR